jgi:signal transduction histidine kinase
MTITFIFNRAMRRRWSASLARGLQFPLVSAIFAWLASIPIVFVTLLLSASGPLGLRFAAAYEGFMPVFLTLGGMVLIGGLTAALIRMILPKSWPADRLAEGSVTGLDLNRMIGQMGWIFLVLGLVYASVVWRISESTVRRMLVGQLTESAGLAAKGLDYFVITGKSQIDDLAGEPQLASQDPEAIQIFLAQKFQAQSFFDLLAVFTQEGNLVSSYPPLEEGMTLPGSKAILTAAEASDRHGLLISPATPTDEGQAAHYIFISKIQNPTEGILLGQTQIVDNVILAPFIAPLKNLENNDGTAQIIDNHGMLLYHTHPEHLMSETSNPRFTTTTFFESTKLDGQSMMLYYQPSEQSGWAVITAFPAEVRYLRAWEYASPLLLTGFVVLLSLLMAFFMIVTPPVNELKRLKSSIQAVVQQALPSHGIGEKQRKPPYEAFFTQTLAALNRRVQQQRDLLTIYGQENHMTNLKEALIQAMKAALAQGVSSVRIISKQGKKEDNLGSNMDPIGLGRDSQLFAALDPQVSSLMRSEGSLILRDFEIEEFFTLPKGVPCPASLIAFPLKSDKTWQGFLWATYPEKQTPGQEEIDFFKLLSARISEILASQSLFEELTKRQRQLEKALNKLSQGVLIIDEGGTVLYHNNAFVELIGSTPQTFSGKNIFAVLKETPHLELRKAFEKGVAEMEIRLEDGNILHFRKEPIEKDGVHSGSVLLFEPLEGFRAKLDSSTELVTVVSHALRSPLTLLHGYAKILRLTGNLNDQQDDYIEKIIHGIEEMRSLVQNLLEVGRLESLGVVDFSEFEVSLVLHKIKDSMEAQFRQKNIKLSILKPEAPVMIRADFTLLTQALKNLVENALKVTKMGEGVLIKVREKDGRVVFSVKDTGPGIAPLDQRHLFAKFQQGKGMGGEEGGGNGLGLAIVRAIVEHHHGRVWVESQLGKGSTFFIEIPKRPD